MAKVIITADTEENTIEVSVDGEKFSEVNSASVGLYETYDDEMKTMVSVTMIPEKVSHLTKQVYISSAKVKEAQEAIANKKASAVSKDGHIVKYEVEADLKASVAKMMGKTENR